MNIRLRGRPTLHRPPAEAGPPVRTFWWRLLVVAGAVGGLIVGYGNLTRRLTPVRYVLFLAAVAMVLFETHAAGWYRGRDPWEGKAVRWFRRSLRWIKWVIP